MVSVNNTTVSPSFITDSLGGVWSIAESSANGGQVCHNGVIDTTTSNVTLLLYNGNIVYQENASGTFYSYSSTGWVQASDPRVVAESANGTTVTTVGPALIDSTGEKWTLVKSATASLGLQIAVNGVVDATTNNVTVLIYENHRVYQENSAGGWWYKANSANAWTATTNPVPTPTPTATPKPTATATPKPTVAPGTIVPPPQAVAVGYTNLVFNDDFTSNTIAPSYTTSSGYNWYWSFTNTNGSECTINTGATAASVSNGNSGGGSFASSAGGILTVNTGAFPNANILTLPGGSLNNGSAKLPPLGTGRWTHFYVEAYIQCKINGNISTTTSNGWPAFWSWAAEGLKDWGLGSSSLNAPATEIDFLETYGSIFGDTPGSWGWAIYDHGISNSPQETNSGPKLDNNWHKYGMLWTPGKLSFFFDDVAVGTASDSNNSLESQSLFLILGTGNKWPLNVDYVRVWQA
jgi:hypothetical protein